MIGQSVKWAAMPILTKFINSKFCIMEMLIKETGNIGQFEITVKGLKNPHDHQRARTAIVKKLRELSEPEPNFHILQVKHIGQTNTREARVKITSERFKKSILIPYLEDTGSNIPALETAKDYLTKRGWKIVGTGDGKDHFYLVTQTHLQPNEKASN